MCVVIVLHYIIRTFVPKKLTFSQLFSLFVPNDNSLYLWNNVSFVVYQNTKVSHTILIVQETFQIRDVWDTFIEKMINYINQ